MRIVGTIPNQKFRIVVYELEKHLYTEVEAGPMKQGFKWPKAKVSGLEAAEKLFDTAFLKSIETRFNEMYAEMERRIQG